MIKLGKLIESAVMGVVTVVIAVLFIIEMWIAVRALYLAAPGLFDALKHLMGL